MIEKYEIWNDKFKEFEGYLFYDTGNDKYAIRLLEDYSGKHPDILFKIWADRGVVDLPQGVVDRWVKGRVFPPNRQGARDMLNALGMKEYNLHDLIVYYEGRCQMDYSYIKRIE